VAVTLGDRYDVIVLGGGLAGLTAGLFAARQGHSTLVLEASVAGGHLVNVEKIEDFPGFVGGVAGFELCPRTQEQAANAGAEFGMARALGLRRSGHDWEVETIDDSFQTRAVIIAVGSAPRSLGIVGEEELEGHGVSHCATCDGPLFRGKPVGVVGGGDSALQEALTLAEFASQVTVFDQAGQLSAQHVYRERASRVPTIEVRHSTLVEEILGNGNVEGVRVRELATGQRSVVPLAGLFPCVGLQPNTAFLQGTLKLDSGGHVPTDIWMRTELPGIFAAGDVRQNSASQAITSAGDGATAAIAAHRYLLDPTWWGRV
jgi:thioredoxin reductase (NADPH)